MNPLRSDASKFANTKISFLSKSLGASAGALDLAAEPFCRITLKVTNADDFRSEEWVTLTAKWALACRSRMGIRVYLVC